MTFVNLATVVWINCMCISKSINLCFAGCCWDLIHLGFGWSIKVFSSRKTGWLNLCWQWKENGDECERVENVNTIKKLHLHSREEKREGSYIGGVFTLPDFSWKKFSNSIYNPRDFKYWVWHCVFVQLAWARFFTLTFYWMKHSPLSSKVSK